MTDEGSLRIQLDKGPPIDSYWKHKKTGNFYRVICTAFIESTMTVAVVYARDGIPWVRPEAEFLERFERWTGD